MERNRHGGGVPHGDPLGCVAPVLVLALVAAIDDVHSVGVEQALPARKSVYAFGIAPTNLSPVSNTSAKPSDAEPIRHARPRGRRQVLVAVQVGLPDERGVVARLAQVRRRRWAMSGGISPQFVYTPWSRTYRSVMNEARAGMHSGPWHDTRENRTPSPASESRAGVDTVRSPAQPIMSARCWSDMMSTMLGALMVTASSSRGLVLAGGPPGARPPEGSSHERGGGPE